jgi:predicted amino acid dehydrogenase
MNKFGFVLHPLDAHDIARKYRPLKYLPESWVEGLLGLMRPPFVSQITDLRSATGASADGCFVGCTATSRQLIEWPPEQAYARILSAIDLAARWGAKIVGLGAFTAVAGDKGLTLAERASVGVTTGNSYTVYTAIEGALKAAELMGLKVGDSRAAVLGATGSIGRACALLLAPTVGALTLVGRRPEALASIAEEVRGESPRSVEVATDIRSGLQDADIVLAVTSATEAIVGPDDVKPGAVLCDVARPRNVSRALAERNDVLVIEGGAVAVPGEDFDFGFDFGFPPGLAYACMAETMILALEGRFDHYSLGPELRLEQVREMGALAQKHGFRLAGFRCFERTVSDEEIARRREAAGR